MGNTRRAVLTTLCGLTLSGCAAVVIGGVEAGSGGYIYSDEIGEFGAENYSDLRDLFGLKDGGTIKLSEIQRVVDHQVDAVVVEGTKWGREYTPARIEKMRAGLVEHYRRMLRWRFTIIDDFPDGEPLI